MSCSTPLSLSFSHVSLFFAHLDQPLFNQISFELKPGSKTGLIGANGVGKTTLINVLLGFQPIDQGEVISPFSTYFWMEQEARAEGPVLVSQYLLQAWPALAQMYRDIQAVEKTGITEPLAYADLIAAFANAGGYERLNEITCCLHRFGFSESLLDRQVNTLSGGERRLLKLISGFLGGFDLILLDEPSNYLDQRALIALVSLIGDYQGTLILVSHDRWLLDQTVTQILELERGQAALFSGGFSQYSETKADILREKRRKKLKLEQEIKHLKEVERKYKNWSSQKEKEKQGAYDKGAIGARAARLNKRAILARDRVRQRIERLEVEKPWIEKEYAPKLRDISLPRGECIRLQDVGFTFHEHPLFQGLNLGIHWGEHWVIDGPNGSGKSTLLKLILGQLLPQQGYISCSQAIRLGYLPQHTQHLDLESPLRSLYHPTQYGIARGLLGQFKLKGDAFFETLGHLSEGQRRKALLVQLILKSPNVLVLDEPTSHLDFQSIQQLENLLLGFQGTLILVSHDQYLKDQIGERQICLGESRVRQAFFGFPPFLR